MKSTIVLIVLAVALLIYTLVPLALIWAVNQLLGLDIQYSFLNWLAVLVGFVGLQALLKTKVEIKRS